MSRHSTPGAVRTAALCVTLFACSNGAAAPPPSDFDSARAWRDVEAQVAIGSRPAGSEALERTRVWLEAELRAAGLEPVREAFTAQTPIGEIEMVNVYADLAAMDPAAELIVLCAHFESKLGIDGFVGANDGASGTAVVLELARVLAAGEPRSVTYRFLFVDGEEALRWEWHDPDNRYGSRHHVEQLVAAGLDQRVRACIVIDMVGDRELRLSRDSLSDPRLLEIFTRAAKAVGLGAFMRGPREEVRDDHLSFMAANIPSLDLIDLRYGPGNSYWHTSRDTLDKCSAESLDVVGRIVLEALPMLENGFARR